MKNKIILLLGSGVLLSASATCPSWPSAERFTFNGAEVTDHRTGLVWSRCSVGQEWSGNACAGTAMPMTHEGALAYAAAKGGWRLPNVKELASLADKGCPNPAIDSVAFPNLVEGNRQYWSSSPYSGGSDAAWLVGFTNGNVNAFSRGYSRWVRLVRSSQQ